MDISIAIDGKEHTIEPTPGDLVRLERRFSISAANMSEDNVTVEQVMFLAFSVLKRTKVIEVDDGDDGFEWFLDHVDQPQVQGESPLAPPGLQPSS